MHVLPGLTVNRYVEESVLEVYGSDPHLDRPAAWLHITDCSRNARSHLLKVSWLKVREAGAEGKLCLATLVKVLLSLAGSGDQDVLTQ